MAHFLGPQKKAKEDLLNKVRNERAERKLIKKKEECSYLIQDWWRGTLSRKIFLSSLRISSDRDNKLISSHCKQQTAIDIIPICFNMIRKLNIFYDHTFERDRNRLTIITANTLKLLSLNDGTHNNYIAFGFTYSDLDKKQCFYSLLHKLWLNINITIDFYHNKYYSNAKSNAKSIITHIKILINFLIYFIDINKWIHNIDDKLMIKSIKKKHPSFIKKYICSKPKIFYKKWKLIIIFCQDLGLKLIASNAVYISVFPTKLSPNLLKEFSQQILSIPYLSARYKDMFIVTKNNSIELSEIWKQYLPLFANSSNNKHKITGKSKGIPNGAWFVSNCSILIKAVKTMNNTEFEQFVVFFSDLITKYAQILMFNDDEIDEKDLNQYHQGFENLYDSDIISKLFWSIFNELLDINTIHKTYRTKVTEKLPQDIDKAVSIAVQSNKNIQPRFEFIHHLIITLHSVKDVKTKYLSTLSFATPCLSVLWQTLLNEIGVPPATASNMERWKDAIFFNKYVVVLLDLFLMCYNHFVFVIEREEFIKQKQPFECKDLVPLIRLLRTLFFQHCSKTNKTVTDSSLSSNPNLVNSIRRFIHQSLDRNTQHKFCDDSTWILDEKELDLWKNDMKSDTDTFAFNILDKMPYCIPFMERVEFMRTVIADEKKQFENEAPTRVLIRRNHVIEDGFAAVNKLGVSFRKRIKVNFVDPFGNTEVGIDMGGVFKEFLELSTREIFSDNYGLFKRTEKDGLYYPNATAKHLLGSECGHLMEFIGRILGKAVLEGICVDIPFAPFFIGKLFGRVSKVEDLFILDPILYKNLMFMKHYDGDVCDLALTFSTSRQILDENIIIDLVHNGRNVFVTNSNRIQYIYKLTRYLLDQQFEYQTGYFVQGFYSICNQKLIKIYSISEFITVLSGTDDEIDVDDWRKFTKYDAPYYAKHRIIKNFWNVVKSMTSDEKKQLLQFTTSNRRPPLMGFRNLQPEFKIQPVSTLTETSNPISSTFQSIFSKKPTKDPLPSSATCFNTLKLPMYTTKKILKHKLLKCIKEAKGFHLS